MAAAPGGNHSLYTQLLAPHWKKLMPAINDSKVRYLVMEHDNPSDYFFDTGTRTTEVAPGEFVTVGPEDGLVIGSENYARYEPFVAIASELGSWSILARTP